MLGVEPRRYGDYCSKSYLKEKNEEFEPKKMDNIQCCLVGSLITTVISGGIGALLSIII